MRGKRGNEGRKRGGRVEREERSDQDIGEIRGKVKK